MRFGGLPGGARRSWDLCAVEAGVQGWTLLDDATRFLRRIEYDPSLTFKAWFL